MASASDYIEDVRRYDSGAGEDTVGKIVKHLGIALQGKDSSLVSASDPTELNRVRDKWGIGKLGLSEAEAGLIVDKVATEMKADRNKQRVTFYYLAAKHAGKLESL
jgi:Protein of unknown function (DUF2853)